jgi:hypothetical protein
MDMDMIEFESVEKLEFRRDEYIVKLIVPRKVLKAVPP